MLALRNRSARRRGHNGRRGCELQILCRRFKKLSVKKKCGRSQPPAPPVARARPRTRAHALAHTQSPLTYRSHLPCAVPSPPPPLSPCGGDNNPWGDNGFHMTSTGTEMTLRINYNGGHRSDANEFHAICKAKPALIAVGAVSCVPVCTAQGPRACMLTQLFIIPIVRSPADKCTAAGPSDAEMQVRSRPLPPFGNGVWGEP